VIYFFTFINIISFKNNILHHNSITYYKLNMRTLILFLFISSYSIAQTVTPLANAEIDSLLLLSNFTNNTGNINISNVVVNGVDSTIGLFNGYSNFPVSNGIVLSTGGAEWALSSSTIQKGPFATPAPITPSPYLTSLSNTLSNPGSGATFFHNKTSIDFDFTPQFDVINFNYVFASCEYKNYTCSQFNDIFGFFLTGPGITGDYHNNSQNLAIVPGSNNTPVCINSINSGISSPFQNINQCEYVDEDFLDYTYLFNENDTTVANYVPFPFNGYTDTLSINAILIPDSTYHIKIIIADARDVHFNSAVLLSSNSFSSFPNNPNVWGCTDTLAYNYDISAIYNDGSCLYTPVGLDELNDIKQSLSLISNPITSNTLQIEHITALHKITIYNSLGAIILENNTGNIDLSALQNGIYIINISDGNYNTSRKFYIEN